MRRGSDSIMKPKKHRNNGNGGLFNAQAFLDTAGVARKVKEHHRGESRIFRGEAAGTVMYIQKGGVKLSVVNGSGKEAVVAMFGPTDFFGEGCMAGQTIAHGDDDGSYADDAAGDPERGVVARPPL